MKMVEMNVTEGLTVQVLPNGEHGYLMTTREVANGFGISDVTLRRHKMEHKDELYEGKHFVYSIHLMDGNSKSGGCSNISDNRIFWTKRGIVRLCFFIKSGRAKLFRDWAEGLIIKVDELANAGEVVIPCKALPSGKRRDNRLNPDRMIRLLSMTHRIEDSNLRNEIVAELIGSYKY